MKFIQVSSTCLIPLSSVQSVDFLPSVIPEELDLHYKDKGKGISYLVTHNLTSNKSLSYTDEESGEPMLACKCYQHRCSVLIEVNSSYKGLFKISTEKNEYVLSYEQMNAFNLDFILNSFSF